MKLTGQFISLGGDFISTRVKLFISTFIFIMGSLLSLELTTNIHLFFSGKIKGFKYIPFDECIVSLLSSTKHLQLFLAFLGLVVLFILVVYFSNVKAYQSELVEITPTILKPKPAGQGQHGTAWWMTEKEKKNAFKSHIMNLQSPLISDLLKKGIEETKDLLEDSSRDTIPSIFSKFKSWLKSVQDKIQSVISYPKRMVIKLILIFTLNSKTEIPKSGGLVVGVEFHGDKEVIHYIGSDTHTLTIGGTRSGKTRCLVLQSIGLIALSGESMILSDPKGELYQYTFPMLKRLGYDVYAIDFKNPLKSSRYNFLQPVIDAVNENDLPKAIDCTWDITSQLVGEAKGEKIWTNGEASIIAASIIAVVYDNRSEQNRKYQNMTNVYYFIANMCKNVGQSMPLTEYVKRLPDSHPSKALLGISEVAPSKTRGSFYTAALTTLQLFTNPLINSMTNASDLDPKDIGKKKTAVFIILPDEKTTYYSLASLLVKQCYMELVKVADNRGGRLERRVNFLLDEFGNFTPIPDFSAMLTVAGGRGMRFNLFLQAFSQLDDKYDREVAKTIKSNCETLIYLFSKELETKEEISKQLGSYTVSTYSLSANHAKYSTPSSSHSMNLTGLELLTSEEVGRIERPYSLVSTRTKPIVMNAPDLSKWSFNKIFGLGNEEHNRLVRETRENNRPARTLEGDLELWNVWKYYISLILNKSPSGGSSRSYGDSSQLPKEFLEKFNQATERSKQSYEG